MIFDRLHRKEDNTTIISSPDELAQVLGLDYATVTGKSVGGDRAMRLTTVFACVRVLSESIGMLPCRLFKHTDGGREKATEHWLNRLLTTAPNDYMTPQEFWELLVVCLCLRGNFYAYKVKGVGSKKDQILELLPLDPGCVEPKLNSNFEPVYRVTFRDGTTDVLGQDKIWHVRILTLDGLVGLNPVAYAREAIALGLSTEEHGSRLFSNGTVTSGVLKTEQQLSDVAFKRLKDEFVERHQGLVNSHKPMILEMGLDWKPITMNSDDAQFLETRKFQRDEICAIFRVPPHLISNLEKSSFNNIENQGMSFVNYSLMAYNTRIEQRINIGLLPPSDHGVYYAKFNPGALLRGDIKSRYESYGVGINWGFLCPNDARELEDMNPRDGGDVYLTPMNMTTKPESSDGNSK